jgi:glycosyltransferase involved in cell wall biosynthesis
MAPDATNDDVVVVVRMHNEAASVGTVVGQLREHFPHVVCVDDGSSDGSHLIARAAGAVVVRHRFNLGGGAAQQTGLTYALGIPQMARVITFDADGQHNVGDALRLLSVARQKQLDVVLGSRFLTDAPVNMPTARRWLLRAATLFTRLTTSMELTDTHNGLRVLSRPTVERLDLTLDGMAYASQLLSQIARHGLTYAEIPVTIEYTEYSISRGQSNLNAFNIVFDLALERLRNAR